MTNSLPAHTLPGMNDPFDAITDDLLDSTPSLPGETVAEYGARIARLAAQTPQQDRDQALLALREILNNPRAKPQDRKAAADSLLKAAADAGKVTEATAQAMDMTDDELLAEVHAARTLRNAGRATAPTIEPEAPKPAPYFAKPGESFLAALDGVADIDPLML